VVSLYRKEVPGLAICSGLRVSKALDSSSSDASSLFRIAFAITSLALLARGVASAFPRMGVILDRIGIIALRLILWLWWLVWFYLFFSIAT